MQGYGAPKNGQNKFGGSIGNYDSNICFKIFTFYIVLIGSGINHNIIQPPIRCYILPIFWSPIPIQPKFLLKNCFEFRGNFSGLTAPPLFKFWAWGHCALSPPSGRYTTGHILVLIVACGRKALHGSSTIRSQAKKDIMKLRNNSKRQNIN